MAQNKSIFAAYVDKFFKGAIGRFTELFNGKREEQTYLYTSMLTEEYTTDLTWNATSLNNSIVAADVVSMDSSLPLKKRSTISHASGDIAKIGIKKKLNEKNISDIMVMQAKGQREADIARRILNNVPAVINGVHTRLEIMFEQALSSGYVLVTDENNEGTGVRVDFGYKDANKFAATAAPWSTPASATPITDLRQMFDAAAANSDSISDVYLSEAYFNYMRKSAEVKELVASANDQVIISSATLPIPNRSKTLAALEDEFSATFHVVNNSYKYEDAAGVQHPIKPWVQGNVVGVPSPNVGRLVYGTLAEDMNRVAGVTYEKSGFILVSEYSHNEPSLEEFTAAQALAMPVIDDGEHIYVLDANSTAAAEVNPDSLEFAAKGGRKTVSVNADSFNASTSDAWLTVATGTKKFTVTAAANTGAARNGLVTVAVGGKTASVTVSQEAAE